MKKGKRKKYKPRKVKTDAKASKDSIKISSKLVGKTPYSIGASVGSTIKVSDDQYLKLGINCNVPIGCKERDKEAVENSAVQMLVSIWKKLSDVVDANNMEMKKPEASGESESGAGEETPADGKEKTEVKTKKGKETEFLDI